MAPNLPPPHQQVPISAIPPSSIGQIQKQAPLTLKVFIEEVSCDSQKPSIKGKVEEIYRNELTQLVQISQTVEFAINRKMITAKTLSGTQQIPIGSRRSYQNQPAVGKSVKVWLRVIQDQKSSLEVAAGSHSFGPDYEHFSAFVPGTNLQPAGQPAKSSPPH